MYNLFVSFLFIGVFTTSICRSQHLADRARPVLHSHNDYEQKNPFFHAFSSGFGSIEADIHLVEGKLYVGHDAGDIRSGRTLAALYLDPLDSILRRSGGRIRSEKKSKLFLLIDIKTDAVPTLNGLIKELEAYPAITKNKNIFITISGNRPKPKEYVQYPDFIHFDGRPNELYDAAALKKVAMISDNYYKYAKWNGNGAISEVDQVSLRSVMAKAHALKKPFRFWATPDTKDSWKFFMELGADFINTDKIDELAAFMKHN